jgi:uncharacterized protein (TIGR03067 family)
MGFPILFCHIVLLALSAPLAEDAKDDPKLLDGRWNLVSMELEGVKVPDEKIKGDGGGWLFKGSEVDFLGPPKDHKASVTLDLTTTPKLMDLVGLEGPQKGKKAEGIFKIEKGQLIICLQTEVPKKGRPTEFKTEAGSNLALMTFDKAK